MALPPLKKLPWELEEEILFRLPLQALVRGRTVCKQWNSLFNDKSFLKNHFSCSRPQFILLTASKVYSIDIIGFDPNSIDPKIELCEIPFNDSKLKCATITTCGEFLFCNNNLYWYNNTALWNPWLRQITWVDLKYNKQFWDLKVVGLGYDNSRPDKVYKILAWYRGKRHQHQSVLLYDCASQAFKSIDTPDDDDCPITTETARRTYVHLNGNLYWLDYNSKTREYFIQSFDFSSENFKPLCLLPCQQKNRSDSLLLAVFEGDRFSLLKLCYKTKNIGVWVTKKKIRYYNNGDDGEGVVWINLMTFSASNSPTLFYMIHSPVSYFIYNKTIFMCSGEVETGVAYIYVVKENICKKFPIASGLANFGHCVYAPSLISLPSFT